MGEIGHPRFIPVLLRPEKQRRKRRNDGEIGETKRETGHPRFIREREIGHPCFIPVSERNRTPMFHSRLKREIGHPRFIPVLLTTLNLIF